MEKKKKNRMRIVAITLVWLVALVAFLMIKTTAGAVIVACCSEGASVTEYFHISMMPKGYDFSSYKDKVVYQIRVDQAEKIRLQEEEERKAVSHEFMSNLANEIAGAYMYNQESSSFQDNVQKYHAFMSDFSTEFVTEEETNAMKVLVDGIASTTQYNMATDAYYAEYSQDHVRTQMSYFLSGMKSSEPQENIVIEQISPGEYDPTPEEGYSKIYAEDIAQVKECIGDSNFDYDYIIRYTVDYINNDDGLVLEVCLVALVNCKNSIIIDAETIIGDVYWNELTAYGDVRPFSNDVPEELYIPAAPIVLSLEGMQAKADQFADLFGNVLVAYFTDADAFNELYEVYTKEANNNETEEGNEDTTNGTVDEDNLKIMAIDEQIKTSINETYSSETEWGSIILLENLSDSMKSAVGVLVAEKLINEGNTQINGNEITEEDKNIIYNQAAAIKNLYTDVKEPILTNSNLVQEGGIMYSELETPVAQKSYEVINNEFYEGCSHWYESNDGSLPYGVIGGYFRYEFENRCTMEIAVLGTNEGLFITDVSIDWVDENMPLQDVTVSTYSTPNTIRMLEEANGAISRDMYETDEEYNYAIAVWLYEHYPDYYENPASDSNDASEANVSYSTGGILRSSSGTGESIVDFVTDAWDTAGYVLEGTLPGYLFTNNGHYQSVGDDLKNAANHAKESISNTIDDVKENVSDWWRDLWN